MCLRARVTAWDAAKANKSEIVGLNIGYNYIDVLPNLRTCFKKKNTIQELMFTFNHWSSPY